MHARYTHIFMLDLRHNNQPDEEACRAIRACRQKTERVNDSIGLRLRTDNFWVDVP